MIKTQSKSHEISGTDYLGTDELFLTEDERTVRDACRDFVAKEILPHIMEWDKGNTAPFGDAEALIRNTARNLAATTGVFGAYMNGIEKYLGPDFTPITPAGYGVAMRELEYGDTALRSLASVQSSLCMFAILEYGSEAQKKKWLPELFAGRKLACFGLTEAQGGSDPSVMLTTAKKTAAGWILNGTKVWITNGFADVAVVWAKTDEGIRGFLVERDTPGYSFRNEEKWALRAGIASSLSMSNCEVPADNLLPGTVQPADGSDLKSPLRCLNEARYGICWGAIGAMRACIKEVTDYSHKRILFGKPLAYKQETQRKLAKMVSETECAQLLALRLSDLKAKGALNHVHVSMGKYNNICKAVEVAQLACELLPADVFTFDAYHSGRHMRNMHVVKKYEGPHEIHTLIIGRAITGVPAF